MHTDTAERTGAHIVLDALAAEGVELVFGYPGGAIMPLYDALFGHPVRHVLVRHEAAAAFAAGGYARASGRVGVCCATSGPGATNLITGITDAMMDSVPLVAITGQVKTALMGTDAFQEADVASIAHAITKRVIVVREFEKIEESVRAAFALARGPRPGPVLVDIPSDVLRAKVSAGRPRVSPTTRTDALVQPEPTIGRRRLATRPPVNVVATNATLELLRHAKKPVAIVGGGARNADAVAKYREFCARLQLPHTATINGLGCAVDGDPNFLGMLGMHGWKAANLAVAQSDLVLGLGIRFDDRVTGRVDRFAQHAKIVHADIDASEFGKIVKTDVALHGDLDDTLDALNKAIALDDARHPTSNGVVRIPAFEKWAGEARALGGPLPKDNAGAKMRATDVLDVFFEVAPAGTVVATDVGQHQMWAAQRARPEHPRDFLTSASLGAMGFGFPGAIGAWFARYFNTSRDNEKPVVAIVGDGGFQMGFAEMATLKRYNVPVKILLIDNRNLGMVRQWQEMFYDERYSATNLSDNPDFCTLASAYGIAAERIEDPADLRGAIERFICNPNAMLLHCACYPEENVWPMIPSGGSVDEIMEPVPAA